MGHEVSLPAALHALVDEVDRLEAEARRVVEGLDDRQVNLPPPGGGWSVAQCLDHLARMNVFYVEAVTADARRAAKTAGAFAGLHPGWVGRWFVRSMEPPVKRKMKAPIAEVRPGPTLSREEAVDAFVASHGPYRELVALAAETNPDRVIVHNPFYKRVRMKLSTVLLIVPAHDRRHLWQARNVVETIRKVRSEK